MSRHDPLAFDTQIKTLINKHFRGRLAPAARMIGVTPKTLKEWVTGERTPGYLHQVNTLRKLRAL
jgi:hypothetical protein